MKIKQIFQLTICLCKQDNKHELEKVYEDIIITDNTTIHDVLLENLHFNSLYN